MAILLFFGCIVGFNHLQLYHFHEVFAILYGLNVLIFQGSQYFFMCEVSVILIKNRITNDNTYAFVRARLANDKIVKKTGNTRKSSMSFSLW